MRLINLLCLAIVFLCIPNVSNASLLMKPVKDPQLQYPLKLLSTNYDQAITHPDEILGFPVGQQVANPAQIAEAVGIWGEQSERLKILEYAKSHEGRPLYAVFISSPKNLQRLDEIQTDITKLADARGINDRQAKSIIKSLPAVAWMAYSIHGNETSGADAAITAIYHLAASKEQQVAQMLDNMIVVIDPLMNPDGRARFVKSLEQYRGTAPNVDDQSLLHRGDWPSGRTNHYFFDLNRDFFYLTQPETKGRVSLINRWRPQLMIDAHEMGSQSTYLMGPPRDPLNANINPSLQKWAITFSEDQGAAFDKKGWRYFTGEWFENWYPGYSNYSEYRGSMHILYEQSRMAEDGVRRPEGTVQTYMESVHHQFVSTMANLKTLAKHSKAMYADYWQGRKQNVATKGPYSERSFVILANKNIGRTEDFVERLLAQDIEVFVALKNIKVKNAVNQLGQTLATTDVPAGSLVIPNRQPEARLLAAIMEFDAAVKPEVLIEERQKNLRDGSSVMYDTTAWNLSMMYGLSALMVPTHMQNNLSPYKAASTVPKNAVENAIAWAVNGADDRSVSFAARLMERGVQVRVVDKAAILSEQDLSRGSVIVTTTDNPQNTELLSHINQTAAELDLTLVSIFSGSGAGILPDWGGQHFRLLTKPQIGILSHGSFSSYDVGATWWSLDTYLGIRHSQLDINSITRADLRRYNTLIMPLSFGKLSKEQQATLKAWVEQGGTLIAHSRSAADLARKKDGLSKVKQVADVLDKAQYYDLALQREWLALQENLDVEQVMQHTIDAELSYPWDDATKPLKKEVLEKREKWQKRFMPSGAIVAGRVDQKHWLSFGVDASLPLLYSDQPVLMSADGSNAVVRIGVFNALSEVAKPKNVKKINDDEKSEADKPTSTTIGWSTLPQGQELLVRMSGLLWPEAAQRIANSAYLTHEKAGSGQIILFSGQPNFRGAARGTNRLLLNAVVYGAGLGSRPKITL
ncbi:MAG: hypothetical protein ACI9NY_002407 [Kiritimatiellia bacterium]|jgi:hypothetical protein